MPLPVYLSCELPFARVYELADGRFQFIEPGGCAPFMAGHRFLLVENALAAYLNSQGLERVRFEPAILFNRVTGEELTSHTRVRVGQIFQPDQISDAELDGLRLLTMNDEFYFASPALAAKLEQSPFTHIKFSEGLDGFAGA